MSFDDFRSLLVHTTTTTNPVDSANITRSRENASTDVDLARRMRDNKRDSSDQRPPRGRPPGTSIPKQQQPMGEIVEVEGGHIVRSTGRKDRHSKVYTAKGPRDRRVRLSALTAIQFYDVQDRLSFDRPSKAVDWLIKKAKTSIDELNQLPRRLTPNIPNQQPKAEDEGIKDQAEQEIELENEASVKGAGARAADSRAITRERARERAKERTQERSNGVAKAQTYLRPRSQLFSLNPASTSPTVPNYHLKNGPASENLGTGSNAAVLIMQRSEIHAMLELIQKFKVTVAPIMPPIVLPIAKNPVVEKYDMSSIRMVLSGAAPLRKDLEDALRARIPNATLAQGYGMTEAGPVLAMSLGFAKVPFIIKSGSCSTVVRNAEMKIIEPKTGVSLPHNHRGEIYIRGPQIMKGYLNDPEATEMTIDKDGWLHTGDVGYIDDDEELFIADRVKELIKYKGFQVPPAELEAILLNHPSIADAAVVSQQDEIAGEVPVAFVVRSGDGIDLTVKEIKEFVAKQVVFYKKLHNVYFIDAIPKSPSGKILRKDLRAKLIHVAAGIQ